MKSIHQSRTLCRFAQHFMNVSPPFVATRAHWLHMFLSVEFVRQSCVASKTGPERNVGDRLRNTLMVSSGAESRNEASCVESKVIARHEAQTAMTTSTNASLRIICGRKAKYRQRRLNSFGAGNSIREQMRQSCHMEVVFPSNTMVRCHLSHDLSAERCLFKDDLDGEAPSPQFVTVCDV